MNQPARTRSKDLEARLLEEIKAIPIVDTHEHLEEEGDLWRLDRSGWAILLHYVSCDLGAAGAPPDLLKRAEGPGLGAEERWDMIEPWWHAIRHGAYLRVLERGLAAVHGIERVSRDTVGAIEAALRASYPRGGYRRALKTIANIDLSLVDPLEPDPRDGGSRIHRGTGSDPEFFLCDYHDRLVENPGLSLRRFAQFRNIEVKDLAGWKRALTDDLAEAAPIAASVKVILGYSRTLDFEPVTEADASRIAARVIRGEELAQPEMKALVDHFIDHLANLAAEHGLPMRFHTGFHAGGRNFLDRTRVEPITGLIRRHPETQFDLFHISYPNFRDAALLAKYYPNVHVDFCWAWAAVPSDARIALDTCLDICPVTKISGFGGDYYHLEGAVGHAAIARENIAAVLAARVAAGRHTEEDAREIARIILRDGPARFFRTEEKRAALRAARGSTG